MLSARIHPHYQGVIVLLIANAIWGLAPGIFKLALTNITPFTLAFLRFFLASLILFPFAAKNLYIHRSDWGKLITMTLCGITINITCFFFGLQQAPAMNAAIIATSAPLFLFVISSFYFREKLKPSVVIGTLIGMAGILLVLGQGETTNVSINTTMGNILFILATMGSVGYVLAGKPMTKKYPAMTLTFWSFFLSSFTFLPFFVYETHTYHTLDHLNTSGIFGLIYGIIFSSAIAYFLYSWGLRKIQTQEVGVFSSIDPVIAAGFSYLYLGEHIYTSQVMGTLLIIVGLIVSEAHVPYPVPHLFLHVRKKTIMSLVPLVSESKT